MNWGDFMLLAQQAAQDGAATTSSAVPASASGTGEASASWIPGIANMWLLIGIGVLLVLGVLAYYLWKRRAAKQKTATTTSAQDTGKLLLKQWRKFFRNLPRRYKDYPVVVVTGAPNANTSGLVDTFLQWREHADLTTLAEAGAVGASFYAGRNVIVAEIASSLTNSRDPQTLRALRKIWKMAGQRLGLVVLAVPAEALSLDNPNAADDAASVTGMRAFLEELRGQAYGRQLRVRLCVTQAQTLVGYPALTRPEVLPADSWLEIRATVFEEGTEALANALRAGLHNLRCSLDVAARKLPAPEFEAILQLYRAVPEMTTALAQRCGWAAIANRASYVLDGLSFVAKPGAAALGHPLLVERFDCEQLERRLDAARIAKTLTLAGIVFAGTIAQQVMHLSKVDNADKTVHRLASTPLPGQDFLDNPEQSRSLAENDAGVALQAMFRSEFLWTHLTASQRKATLVSSFQHEVEHVRFIPTLSNESASATSKVASLAFLYAGTDDALRQAVDSDIEMWTAFAGVPSRSALHYLLLKKAPWSGDLAPVWRNPDNADLPGYSADWASRLARTREAFSAQTLDEAQISEIQQLLPPSLLSDSRQHFAALSLVAGRLGQIQSVRAILPDTLTRAEMGGWVQQNYDTLHRLIAVVSGTAAEDQLVASSLGDLRHQLQRLLPATAVVVADEATTAPGAQDEEDGGAPAQEAGAARPAAALAKPTVVVPPEVIVVRLAENEYRFEVEDWRRLTRASSAKRMIEQYLAAAQEQSENPLLANLPATGTFGAPRGGSNGPTATIDRRYSRASFSANIRPTLAGFSQEIGKLQSAGMIDADLAAELRSHVVEAAAQYADAYRQAYDTYCNSVQFSARRSQEIYEEINAVTYSRSWLVDFLAFVSGQTDLDLDDSDPFMEPLVSALTVYDPLHEVMLADNGAYPGLAPLIGPYVDLVGQVQSHVPVSGAQPDDAQATSFDESMGPLGAVVLSTLRAETPDARAEIRKQTALSHLTPELAKVLIEPIDKFYRAGSDELNAAVATAWKSRVLPKLRPVVTAFPFSRASTVTLPTEQLASLLSPKGAFFVELQGYFGRALEPNSSERFRLVAGIAKPSDYDEIIEEILRVSATLWDENGKARALLVQATILPLTKLEYEHRLASTAYLGVGTTRISGFNERPTSRDLEVLWQDEMPAELGLVFGKAGASSNDITVPLAISPQPFAFYRLLAQGQPIISKNYRLSWTLVANTGISMSIEFRRDPWLDVSLPRTSRALEVD